MYKYMFTILSLGPFKIVIITICGLGVDRDDQSHNKRMQQICAKRV